MRIYRLNNLNLEHLLKNVLHRKQKFIDKHKWKYDYLITKILFQKIILPYKKYHTFSQTHLQKRIGRIKLNGKSNNAQTIVRNDLKKLGVIDFKITGESDFEMMKFKTQVYYKISDEFLDGGWQEVNYHTKHIEEEFIKPQDYTGIYSLLQENLKRITIDYEAALIHLESLNIKETEPKRYSKYLMCINKINDGNTSFTVDFKSTYRVFHFATSLPKIFRKFLRIDGKPIIETDVSNSQPLVFCKLIMDYTKELTDDMKLYISLCEKGQFYDFLAEKIGVEKTLQFKKDFFGKVFYSTEKKYYKWRKVFDRHFPNVSTIISFYKKDCYKNLPIQLQRFESEIMISIVSKALLERGINEFFTLHDAIYSPIELKELIKEEITNGFQKYGLTPNVKFGNYTQIEI